ncbi:hypothetical protein [Actinoalloteichus caeruleus]|uniref:hypothetical protein n=1 Tax=Actinoalloteichus cyanogriseus TaxID=2893586 RepID=UPI003BB87C03
MGSMMRWGLVSGDGLPVSGLLTVFRNVVDHAVDDGVLHTPVAADLGYSWRADKADYFPRGMAGSRYPHWLTVTDAVPVDQERTSLMAELTEIRLAVARAATLSEVETRRLRERIDRLARPYEEHFTRWLSDHDIDWVIAVNLTLSDAVPVNLALRRAAARYWRDGRPGGVLYWDHDLFGSCAIPEGDARFYPPAPNSLTPVPGGLPSDRWAVVTEGLAEEAAGYPTASRPRVTPNVLPVLPESPELDARHREFLVDNGLTDRQPVVLVPVRLFRVKGVEISVSVFAEMLRTARDAGDPDPALLVFGSVEEDPPYAAEVLDHVRALDVTGSVRFLDGVPLTSHREDDRWRLDEIDLLRICRATGGAVLFTPNLPDVETVGLGPALAALADVPCAVTDYDAFESVYQGRVTCVVADPAEPRGAAAALSRWMAGARAGDRDAVEALRRNHEAVRALFPSAPWRELVREMADSLRPSPVGAGAHRSGPGSHR